MLVILLKAALALNVIEIPSTGTPPEKLTSIECVYNPTSNEIITFGGFNSDTKVFSSSISIFSLTTMQWRHPTPQSLIIPEGLSYSKLFLRPDQTILAFFGAKDSGISSDVFSYNLLSNTWKLEILKGDFIPASYNYAFTSFTYDNAQVVAIFGGITQSGPSNSLYIIDTTTLTVKKLVNDGDYPNVKIGATLVFYNKKLLLYGESWITSGATKYEDDIFEYSLNTMKWSIINVNGTKPLKRSNHYTYISDGNMFVFYGFSFLQASDEVWRFSISEEKWYLIKNHTGVFRLQSGIVGVGNIVYFISGTNTTAFLNSIIAYELSSNSAKIKSITQNWNSPTARKSHCMLTISDKIYVFGGQSSTGEYLNDLWVYNIGLNYWEPVESSGEPPSPRSSFGCIKILGAIIGVFGGKDSTSIYQDYFYFDTASSIWIKALPSTNSPLPRYNSCVCYYTLYFFTIGGQNNQIAFSDIWLYNYFTRTNVYIGDLPTRLTNHECWASANGTIISIYVLGGTSFNGIPSSNLYLITYSFALGKSGLISISTIFSSRYIAISESASVVIGDNVIVLFGLNSKSIVSSIIVKLDYKTLKLSVEQLSSSLGLFDHSASCYRDSVYVFGGVKAVDLVKVNNIASGGLFQIVSTDYSAVKIPCSSGTFGDTCVPCSAGTVMLSGVCTPCPAGTYSKAIAADSASQCTPCSYGYFTSNVGSILCHQCPSYAYCPVNSGKIKEFQVIAPASTLQPAAYVSDSSLSSTLNSYSWFFLLTVSIFLIFTAIISNNIYRAIQKFDIMTSQHSQQLNVPVMYRRTSIGGIFSIAFVITAITLITVGIISFKQNNINEIRTLVPVATVTELIKAELFEADVIYYFFGGDYCVNSDGDCLYKIVISGTGFTFDSKTVVCRVDGENCNVNLKYYGFTLVNNSVIAISLTGMHYAADISVNVSVSSSIPDQLSSVFIPIMPESPETLFRGTEPSILYYEVNPSVFTSESSQWDSPLTGYHIMGQGLPKIGSTVTPQQLYSKLFVLLEMHINIGSNGFMISRNINTSWLMFLGTTLGSVFGLLGTFASVMGLFENVIDKVVRKGRRNKEIISILEERRWMEAVFGVADNAEKYEVKVHPVGATMENHDDNID